MVTYDIKTEISQMSIKVVGFIANLSCSCDHYVNGENEPDKKIERQRTSPSELILFWSHVTRPNLGLSLSLSRSVGTGRREPWERGWGDQSVSTNMFGMCNHLDMLGMCNYVYFVHIIVKTVRLILIGSKLDSIEGPEK